MKRIEFKLPQNLWQLSDKEIAVIQALAFYHPDGMTKEADKVYSYVYQSSTTLEDGDFIITIKATLGAYTSVVQDYVTLVEQD